MSDFPIKTVRLNSGATLLVASDPREPVVALQAWIKAGSGYERPEEVGFCHLLEHMLFQAAKSPDGSGPAEAFEELGGHLNAFTSPDEMAVYASLPAAQWRAGLDVLCRLLFPDSFPKPELENEKQVVLEEMRRENDSPDRQLFRDLLATAFPEHPYGRPVLGDPRSIQTCTPSQLARMHQRLFHPERIVFSVVGDVRPEKVTDFLNQHISDPVGQNLIEASVVPEHLGLKTAVLEKDLFEHRVAIGWPVPRANNPQSAALELLTMLWGQGASSPLEQALCWERNWVNEAGTFLFQPAQTGLGVLTLFGLHESFDSVLRTCHETLRRLMLDGPSAPELEKVKSWVEASQAYGAETVEGRAHRYGENQLRYEDAHVSERFLHALQRVSSADVQSVARKFMGSPNATVIAHVPQGHAQSFAGLEATWRQIWQSPRLSTVPAPVTSPTPQTFSKTKNRATSKTRSEKTTVAGTIPAVFHPTNKIPAVHLYIGWRGGVSFEPASQHGVGSLTSEMLGFGPENHSRDAFAAAIDSNTTRFGPFYGRNATGVHFGCVSSKFEKALGLIADAIRAPRFAQPDFSRHIEHLTQAYERRLDYPSSLVLELFRKALWGQKHPYGRLPNGTPKVLKERRIDELKTWHQKIYRNTQPYLSIVGDFDPGTTAALLTDRFDFLRGAQNRLPLLGPSIVTTGPTVTCFPAKGDQAHLVLGFPGVRVNNPDNEALMLLMACLGGQSGRLFQELREKRGLCYHVQGFQLDGMHPGAIGFYVGCAPEKLRETILCLEQILEDVRTQPLSPEEIMRARNRVLGQKLLAAQTIQSQASAFCINQVVGLPHDEHMRLQVRLQEMNPQKLRAVAQRYFVTQQQTTAVVGPAPYWPEGDTLDGRPLLNESTRRIGQ